MWNSVGEACRWKHPRAPSAQLLSQDDRTTPFLQGNEIGRAINLSSFEEEGDMEEIELGPRERVGGWGELDYTHTSRCSFVLLPALLSRCSAPAG